MKSPFASVTPAATNAETSYHIGDYVVRCLKNLEFLGVWGGFK